MPRTSLSSIKPLVQSCLNDIKAYFLSIYMTGRGNVYACLYMWRSEWVFLCWPCRYASSCSFVMNNAKTQWWSYTSAFLQAFALAGAGNELCVIVYVFCERFGVHICAFNNISVTKGVIECISEISSAAVVHVSLYFYFSSIDHGLHVVMSW